MKGFIEETLATILKEGINPSQTTFVLPSKRAGNFLKEHLRQRIDYTSFAPAVFSIEEFIAQVSELKNLDNTRSLFKFYESYRALTPKEEQESFEIFYGWAQTLIYDFNEIDRFLVDTDSFFSYLAKIQDINHWSIAHKENDLIKNYLSFWNKLSEYYDHFTRKILAEKEVYQGLMYRQAASKIEDYLKLYEGQLVFMGFNALNASEQKIIQTALNSQKAKVFWDTDQTFFKDPTHEASLFLRQYQRDWAYYKEGKNKFLGIADNFSGEKKIECIGIPKNIGQAKYIGQILKGFSDETLNKTALVLNDEGLLSPLLNSLPNNINGLNITMGLPLSETPLASLFELLFKIQEQQTAKIYYKYLLDVLNHPAMVHKLGKAAATLQAEIQQKNIVFITQEALIASTPREHRELLQTCFADCKNNPEIFLENLANVAQNLKPAQPEKYPVETEYLFHFHQVFQKIQQLLKVNHPIKTLKALYRIYTDSLSTVSLDFSGSPFGGLQAMGMLESRVLDFETVILTSVNEGILPSGKSTNSFIPYELKKQYGLPTYKEKDAVYTYHFYRLLQRAKNVYLLYNADQNGFNAGEKSRFINQLEVEKRPQHSILQKMANPPVPPISRKLKVIEKTPEVIAQLKKHAENGFSPSALTSYIRNPIEFYKRYLLGIRDVDTVEETVAANTLGTIVHDTLECFYKPFEGKEITETDLKTMRANVPKQIKMEFQKTYHQAPIDQGKNLLIFEVAKRYVHNFLQTELKNVGEAKMIVRKVESKLKTGINLEGLDFPLYLSGKVDRVDTYNENTRIIDYKTGKVLQTELNLPEWDLLTTDYKYSKAFQVLCYARMMQGHLTADGIQAGIISFKNLKSGFLKFTDKTGNKNQTVTAETLSFFDGELKRLIKEIMDPEIPFTEKIIAQ